MWARKALGGGERESVGGTWKDLTDSVNSMAATSPTRSVHRGRTTAVAKGDLSTKITG